MHRTIPIADSLTNRISGVSQVGPVPLHASRLPASHLKSGEELPRFFNGAISQEVVNFPELRDS